MFFCIQVFDDEEEELLVAYIVKCSNHYYGLSITELRRLAYEFAVKIKKVFPESWVETQMAGYAWYYAFMKRHTELSIRTPEQTSLNRVKAFCKENVDTFFGHLKSVISPTPFPSDRIYNMDETGFSTVPSKVGKVISLKGQKRVGRISSAERGPMVTMALAVNAYGNSIPPFFLFPRKNMKSYFMDNTSPDAVGFANDSGWMQQNEFVKFMEHFIKHSHSSKQSPTLLLLDNHGSHLSVEAIDMAANNGITLLSFPPHCSHRMQPLDVSVYGPLKTYYKTKCDSWLTQNAGKVLEMRHIPGLVTNALGKALAPQNIKSGFECTGIFPFQPDIFGEADFIQAVVSGENNEATAVENLYDVEELRRICVSPGQQEVTANEEISFEPSTSAGISTVSREKSLSSLLSEIGPMQAQTPKPKSNRGRKSMKSTVLTSPESIAALKEARARRDASKAAKEANAKKKQAKTSSKITAKKKNTTAKEQQTPKPAKRSRKRSTSSSSTTSDNRNFCMMCGKDLPIKLTCKNSIKCFICKKPAHLKCVSYRNRDFMCNDCNSGGQETSDSD